MNNFLHPENEFLRKIIEVVEENISDEQFGVSELAEKMNMSRSNLLRKVKKLTESSVSVFIRLVRLHHARELLKDETLTASEVSYRVGFNSTSYFTKCFREAFGYTPGEEKRVKDIGSVDSEPVIQTKRSSKWMLVLVTVMMLFTVAAIFFYKEKAFDQDKALDKSIAVLPFKNDSNDSSNIYIVNGMMEAILDNLQKVEDLKVTSRTTVEKYRSTIRSIPELSKELEVSYFVEGSGQKMGDKILLSVQLIKASTDQHLWSKRYERETGDIFKLQAEVAKDIANEIEVVITPEEQRQIEKVPTQSAKAYDHYLKGVEYANAETMEGLHKAIGSFKQAIAEDKMFAQAYAYMAICYYYSDVYQADKKYGLELKFYAEEAYKLDPEQALSLMARGLYFMHEEDYEQAVQFFEKALEIAPNSGWIHNFLTDIYTSYIPDTQKYLKHALVGIRTAVASQDSITASFSYLHLSNALAQSGFIKEARRYVKKSLAYNPDNLYSQYLHTYIKLVENFDLQRAKNELIAVLKKDTTRLDVMQEVAKVCYTMKDYEEAWKYYKKFTDIRENLQLDIFTAEDAKIGYVLEQLGRREEAEKFYEQYRQFAEKDESVYKDLLLSSYYAVQGDVPKGITYLKQFASQKDYMYWIVLFLDKDPIMQELASHPDFRKTIKLIEDNFWKRHQSIRTMLDEEGVI